MNNDSLTFERFAYALAAMGKISMDNEDADMWDSLFYHCSKRYEDEYNAAVAWWKDNEERHDDEVEE